MVMITKYKLQLIKENTHKYNLENKKISNPKDIYNFIKEVYPLYEEAEEILMVIALNTKNEVIGLFEVSRGSISETIVHPREIFKRVLLINATKFIMVHNHPSNDTTPSEHDLNITKRIKSVGELVGVELLEHLIVGDSSYTSLREKGVV